MLFKDTHHKNTTRRGVLIFDEIRVVWTGDQYFLAFECAISRKLSMLSSVSIICLDMCAGMCVINRVFMLWCKSRSFI